MVWTWQWRLCINSINRMTLNKSLHLSGAVFSFTNWNQLTLPASQAYCESVLSSMNYRNREMHTFRKTFHLMGKIFSIVHNQAICLVSWSLFCNSIGPLLLNTLEWFWVGPVAIGKFVLQYCSCNLGPCLYCPSSLDFSCDLGKITHISWSN